MISAHWIFFRRAKPLHLPPIFHRFCISSLSSLSLFSYMLSIYRVNGGQRWWALAFSGILPLYLWHSTYVLLWLFVFYLANNFCSVLLSSTDSFLLFYPPTTSHIFFNCLLYLYSLCHPFSTTKWSHWWVYRAVSDKINGSVLIYSLWWLNYTLHDKHSNPGAHKLDNPFALTHNLCIVCISDRKNFTNRLPRGTDVVLFLCNATLSVGLL